MAKATITIEDIDAENASLEIDWHGQYNEESGAHRLAEGLALGAERDAPEPPPVLQDRQCLSQWTCVVTTGHGHPSQSGG